MKSIYQKVLSKYGIEAQLFKLFEEIGELLQALVKHKQKGRWKKRIIGEVADVEVMLEQIKYYYKINKEVNKYKKEKLLRLKRRLK